MVVIMNFILHWQNQNKVVLMLQNPICTTVLVPLRVITLRWYGALTKVDHFWANVYFPRGMLKVLSVH